MKVLLTAIFFASVIFLLIDIIWLSFAVKVFYRPNLGQLLLDKPIIWAAVLFYLMYVAGVGIVVINPALSSTSPLLQSLIIGFVFGFVAYGTYNFTNMATIKGWSPYVVLVDIFWGGFLTATSSSIGISIAKYIFK